MVGLYGFAGGGDTEKPPAMTKKRITRSIKAYRHFPCMYLTLGDELKCDAVYALSRRLAE
jgi:hypothetical protein